MIDFAYKITLLVMATQPDAGRSYDHICIRDSMYSHIDLI